MGTKVKLVYKDGDSTKLLFGNILTEDDTFVTFLAEDNTEFRINKQSVISIKTVGNRLEVK